MKTNLLMLALLVAGFFSCAQALAQETPPEGTTNEALPADARVTGRAPPPLNVELDTSGLPEPGEVEPMIGSYPARIVNGAQMLQMDVDFVNECWLAMEGLYTRNYSDSKQRFINIERRWGSGVGPVGEALIWQALMLENFDFRYDKQYNVTFRRAQQGLQQSLMQPGNDTWETFLLGAILGVDAIHAMRKYEFITAINRGLEAMKYVARAAELAPDFVDAKLGDGLWLYWRSVVAINTTGVPSFADEREKGIQMMQEAQARAVFLRPAAAHALTYTWIEEGKMSLALQTAARMRDIYPDNVVNLLVLGRIQMYKRLYEDSEVSFKRVLTIDDDNQRVHYYMQRMYLRWRKLELSEQQADIYLAFPDISDDQRGYALFYKGHIRYRQQRYPEARTLYEEAWKVARIKSAKSRIERIDEQHSGN
jgi:tetratricopeptide (TPR) repeat protein